MCKSVNIDSFDQFETSRSKALSINSATTLTHAHTKVMTLEKSTDSYLLLDQEAKTDYEDTLVRDAICGLRKGLKGSSISEAGKLKAKMGRLSACAGTSSASAAAVSLGKDEDLVAKVHLALWPRNDMETFYRVLQDHPKVVNSTFGKCQDTLLHK